MRKMIAKRWADALRSGKYKKAKYGLHVVGRGYCALGVLCDIAPEFAGKWKNGDLENDQAEDFGNGESSSTELPLKVQRWAGMKSCRGRLPTGGSLTGLNDGTEMTFTEIADVIEKNADAL